MSDIELTPAIFKVIVYKTGSNAIEREEIEFVCETAFTTNGTLTLGDIIQDGEAASTVYQPVAIYAPGAWISCIKAA